MKPLFVIVALLLACQSKEGAAAPPTVITTIAGASTVEYRLSKKPTASADPSLIKIVLEPGTQLVVIRPDGDGVHEHTYTLGDTGGAIEAEYNTATQLLAITFEGDKGTRELDYYQSPIFWQLRPKR